MVELVVAADGPQSEGRLQPLDLCPKLARRRMVPFEDVSQKHHEIGTLLLDLVDSGGRQLVPSTLPRCRSEMPMLNISGIYHVRDAKGMDPPLPGIVSCGLAPWT
jgi:hypothetical protein